MRITLLLVLLVACGCSTRRDIQKPIAVEPLTLAAAEDFATEPQITVNGDRAVASWIENSDELSTLKFAEYAGGTWTAPRTAASGKDWFLNLADVPSVMRLDDGTLVAEYLRTTDEPNEAYDVLLAFSKDEGRTWSAPVTPHHDGTKTQHGFASLYQIRNGPLGLIWLDGRRAKLEANTDDMTVRAAVFAADGRQTSESLVDNRACECCPTSIAIAADGPIAAYRDRSDTEVRNIAVSRLVNGSWTAPAPVHDDGWKINGCPVNGPAVAADGRGVAVAWFTGKDDQGRAWVAFSSDAGATFGSPTRLDDDGSLGRVAIAMTGADSAAAIWVESANGRTELKLRQVDGAGRRGPSQSLAPFNRDHGRGYPRLVRVKNDLLFAWNEIAQTKSTIHTAVARLH
jgi:hypothetical protein